MTFEDVAQRVKEMRITAQEQSGASGGELRVATDVYEAMSLRPGLVCFEFLGARVRHCPQMPSGMIAWHRPTFNGFPIKYVDELP